MKLHELENEINAYTRIRRQETMEEGYFVKSLIADSPLVFCDFMSLQMLEHHLTIEEILADDWEIFEGDRCQRPSNKNSNAYANKK